MRVHPVDETSGSKAAAHVQNDHFLVIIFLIAAFQLVAQEQPAFHSQVSLVTVPCVVTDAKGVSVRDLRMDDFRVYSDDVQQEIKNLWFDSDLPLTIVIIVDVSDSQRTLASKHEKLATQFLEHVIGARDRGFVVAVKEDVVVRSEVSKGQYGLREKLLPPRGEPLGVQCGQVPAENGRWRSLCGGTALWNAVYAATKLKLAPSEGNKALLILSDGNDTGSTHDLNAALAQLQLSGTAVYALRYPDSGAATDSSDGLARLARETGGALFESPEGRYSEILSRIESDLRSRYILGFLAKGAGVDHARHTLRVEVAKPGVTVRARETYLQ